MKQKTAITFPLFALASVFYSLSSNTFADITGTMSASNLYLFRGFNISGNDPQIAGSVDYAHDAGLYAGIWASSEGFNGGQEYDLYVGFSGEHEGFGYDIQVIDFNYPNNGTYFFPDGIGEPSGTSDEDIGDFSELIITLSAGPASFTFIDSLQGQFAYLTDQDSNIGAPTFSGYYYYAYAFTTDLFQAKLGYWDFPSIVDDDMTHLDLTLYIADEFSFTASKIVDNPKNQSGIEFLDDDLLFVATWSKSYSL